MALGGGGVTPILFASAKSAASGTAAAAVAVASTSSSSSAAAASSSLSGGSTTSTVLFSTGGEILLARLLLACRFLTQCAFALSPLVAYMPQYMALTRQARRQRKGSDVLQPSSYSGTARPRVVAADGGAGPSAFGPPDESAGLPSCCPVNENNEVTSNPIAGTSENGFSPTSILLLLSSHTLRLVYFLGSALLSFSHDSQSNGDAIRIDLVAQSIVTIYVQILLFRATTQIAAFSNTLRKRESDLIHYDPNPDSQEEREETFVQDDDDSDDNPQSAFYDHDGLLSHQQDHASEYVSAETMSTDVSARRRFGSTSRERTEPGIISTVQHNNNSNDDDTPPSKRSLAKHRKFWPFQLFNSNSNETAAKIMLLIFVMLALAVTLMFLFFPHLYVIEVGPTAHTLRIHAGYLLHVMRDVSIVLESCLALPQLIQNRRRRDTSGLSPIMVLSWVCGDFLKLLYFGSQLIVLPSAPLAAAATTTTTGEEKDGAVRVFALGCILALILDCFVTMQVVFWYPTREVAEARESIRKSTVRLLFASSLDSSSKKTTAKTSKINQFTRYRCFRFSLNTTTTSTKAAGATTTSPSKQSDTHRGGTWQNNHSFWWLFQSTFLYVVSSVSPNRYRRHSTADRC